MIITYDHNNFIIQANGLIVAAPVREGGGAELGHLDEVEDQDVYSQYFIFFLTYKLAQ
jgi:hypothetical protein